MRLNPDVASLGKFSGAFGADTVAELCSSMFTYEPFHLNPTPVLFTYAVAIGT